VKKVIIPTLGRQRQKDYKFKASNTFSQKKGGENDSA
jgi:hypothetical protein